MKMFADVLSHLLVAYMVLVWPWRGRRRYQTLQNELTGGASDVRIDVYRRMLLHQAGIVLVVLMIAWAGTFRESPLGS